MQFGLKCFFTTSSIGTKWICLEFIQPKYNGSVELNFTVIDHSFSIPLKAILQKSLVNFHIFMKSENLSPVDYPSTPASPYLPPNFSNKFLNCSGNQLPSDHYIIQGVIVFLVEGSCCTGKSPVFNQSVVVSWYKHKGFTVIQIANAKYWMLISPV